LDTFNLQGLVDLEAAETTITGLQGDLFSCEGNAAQCSTDLSVSQASLTVCTGDLSSCIGTATQLEADLLLTQTDLAQTQTDLSQAQSDITLLQADLASTEADLQQTAADLAVATADTDTDGVRDTADACPGTTADAEVDLVGCSHVQFCSGIDASTGPGGATCNNSDWQNDEARAQNPDDCKAKQGVCVPLG
jgi:hypothetical protein